MIFKKVETTAICMDLRNFTPTFKFFDEKDDASFLKLIDKINSFALMFLNIIGSKYYITSTGDGLLILIFGEMHFKIGFAFSLLYSKVLDFYINNFNCTNENNLGYGIGLEAGHVQQIRSEDSPNYIQTYLGHVINIAARIEAQTKTHARANIIIGEKLNGLLVNSLFNTNYQKLVDLTLKSTNQETAKSNINKMNDLNQKLMLLYLFEHNLKGVDKPQKIFRVSPTLSNIDNVEFWVFLKQALPESRFLEIKKTILEEIT